MLIIKTDNTNTHIPTMVKEALDFAKKFEVAVEITVNGEEFIIMPFDDAYDVIEEIRNS